MEWLTHILRVSCESFHHSGGWRDPRSLAVIPPIGSDLDQPPAEKSAVVALIMETFPDTQNFTRNHLIVLEQRCNESKQEELHLQSLDETNSLGACTV